MFSCSKFPQLSENGPCQFVSFGQNQLHANLWEVSERIFALKIHKNMANLSHTKCMNLFLLWIVFLRSKSYQNLNIGPLKGSKMEKLYFLQFLSEFFLNQNWGAKNKIDNFKTKSGSQGQICIEPLPEPVLYLEKYFWGVIFTAAIGVRIPVVAVKFHNVYDYTIERHPWQVSENHKPRVHPSHVREIG